MSGTSAAAAATADERRRRKERPSPPAAIVSIYTMVAKAVPCACAGQAAAQTSSKSSAGLTCCSHQRAHLGRHGNQSNEGAAIAKDRGPRLVSRHWRGDDSLRSDMCRHPSGCKCPDGDPFLSKPVGLWMCSWAPAPDG